jgi:cephalosporin-C deacetylase-like acetyl esterase
MAAIVSEHARAATAISTTGGFAFAASYTPDRIRNALPIVPFTFGNQRVQRFQDLLFTESCNEIFQILLNFTSYWRMKLRRNIHFVPVSPTF